MKTLILALALVLNQLAISAVSNVRVPETIRLFDLEAGFGIRFDSVVLKDGYASFSANVHDGHSFDKFSCEGSDKSCDFACTVFAKYPSKSVKVLHRVVEVSHIQSRVEPAPHRPGENRVVHSLHFSDEAIEKMECYYQSSASLKVESWNPVISDLNRLLQDGRSLPEGPRSKGIFYLGTDQLTAEDREQPSFI